MPNFPERAFRSWFDEYPDAPRIYYGLFLQATSEASLLCASDDANHFRLTYLPGGGAPLVIHVTDDRARALVRWSQLEAPVFMLPPGEVTARSTMPVDRVGIDRLTSALERSAFWTSPTSAPPSGANDPGVEWLIEARVGGRYHVVLRSSPEGEFRDLGRMFFRLAGRDERELAPDAPGVRRRAYRPNGVIPGLPPPLEEPPPPPPPEDAAARRRMQDAPKHR